MEKKRGEGREKEGQGNEGKMDKDEEGGKKRNFRAKREGKK